MLVIDSPTTARFSGYEDRLYELEPLLTYRDKSAEWTWRKAKKSSYLAFRLGDDYTEYLLDLQAKIKKKLLFEDEKGLYTHSGLAHYVADVFNDEVEDHVELPVSGRIPWLNVPDKSPRPYQVIAWDKLVSARHAAVEIGTGLGKSFIILMIAKDIGLKTLIMAPSKSIAGQLYKEFLKAFGKAKVGKFFEGKKESDKLFVIAVDKSLSLVKEGTEHWNNLFSSKVFIADESHLCPAVTLAKVCFGLASAAPYRFFFSGTQMRNDGADKLLTGITGPVVFQMTVREGVDQHYLAKPIFTMVKMDSQVAFSSDDPNEQTRAHLFYNPDVNRRAGQIANMAYEKYGPVLILVEEVEQIAHLLPHFRFPASFAHGGLTKGNKGKVPQQFHDADVDKLVADFNAGKIPILVGTSCISTGTDLCANKATIYLQGGKSEIQVRQGPVGRSTRLHDGKTECMVYDFSIDNIETLKRHSEARAKIYTDVYDPPTWVQL
jgi:superfamily II DNA or RNA helicase